jgi:hypothetical protein
VHASLDPIGSFRVRGPAHSVNESGRSSR